MARRAAPRHTGAMKTVYLVEDAPLVRQRLLELLEGVPDTRVLGISARAGDAIREILAERPDVVIVDLHLAEGSGFDVLRAVHEAAPEIAVYVLTSFAAEPTRRVAARLGASGFFDKTTEFERVREVVAARAAQGMERRTV
jgi:DNA-binding NarL/FixJ family response regulator